MRTTREPSVSLEDIMKVGPIPIHFGTQYVGDAIPRAFPGGGFGFSLNDHLTLQSDLGVPIFGHASLIMMVRPDPASYRDQAHPSIRLSG